MHGLLQNGIMFTLSSYLSFCSQLKPQVQDDNFVFNKNVLTDIV